MWIVGSNFIPSNAVNELTMFQSESYDPETIDRELGYAEKLGFNAMRVFAHNLLWNDSETFLKTMESFLQIASSHNIGIMLVLLDSCWNAYPALGKQPDPTPYMHNSQWVQAPGIEIVNDPAKFMELKPYITGMIEHFQNDSRIIAWYVNALLAYYSIAT
jgi:endo-1,4-beta-mannosidase